MQSFKQLVEESNVEKVVWDGDDLISPFPKIMFGGKIRTEQEFLKSAMAKFSYSSVIQAMKNKKIILVL